MNPEPTRSVDCPNCGATSTGGDRFCRTCGGDLTPVPASAVDGAEPGEDHTGASSRPKRILWIGAAVLVAAGLVVAIVLTRGGSGDPSGADVAADVPGTTAPVGDAAPATTLPEPAPLPEALFPVKIDGRHGYIDRSGTLVIDAVYESGGTFSQGLAPVLGTGGWGYIDMRNEWVIPPRLDLTYASPFSEDLAAVETEDGWGYIDETGAWMIEPQERLSWASGFSEGLAAVKIVHRWGYIDTTGTVTIESEFIRAHDFSEGVAAVETLNGMGYIDANGDWVIAPSTGIMTSTFSDGMAAATDGTLWGYIDHGADWLINPQFMWAGRFSDGLAPFLGGAGFGYIDQTGAVVIPANYDDARPFHDGLGRVMKSEGVDSVKYGYIDRSGEWVWMPTE